MISNITHVDNRQNFCGRFISNELLSNALKYASSQDLYEFSQNLKKMRAQKDKRDFWLSENWNSTPFSIEVKTHLIQLNSKKSEKTTTNPVGSEAILQSRKYSVACYKHVIKNINAALNKIYPDK